VLRKAKFSRNNERVWRILDLKFYMKYVARIGEVKSWHTIILEKIKGRHHLEDLGVDGRIILQRFIMLYGMRM
jgi:hypothetical protein